MANSQGSWRPLVHPPAENYDTLHWTAQSRGRSADLEKLVPRECIIINIGSIDLTRKLYCRSVLQNPSASYVWLGDLKEQIDGLRHIGKHVSDMSWAIAESRSGLDV